LGFPVYLNLGPVQLHPHWVFESLAYLVGFRLYTWRRARAGDHLGGGDRMWVVVAAIAGAALGSKLLYWLSDPLQTARNWNNLYYLMAGKTIVGGLLGGLIAVEWIKRRLRIERRTGDLFAIPLAAGISIGRVGCFLSGLTDDTYGVATSLPWGIDFGDGVARHPTQLYEVAWLALLALWLWRLSRKPHREGDLFKTFMVGYLGFRLLIDFLKPGVALIGLTGIQWACVAALAYYSVDLPRLLRRREEESV
jgi:prolipoprotein diacylglyceryltransferase